MVQETLQLTPTDSCRRLIKLTDMFDLHNQSRQYWRHCNIGHVEALLSWNGITFAGTQYM